MLVIQRPTVDVIDAADGNRQRFAIGPLEPGFGHTIGNSLRRALLSSIPGAAVTQVRFDDALHEFATIPGVTEDVTDILLNLKDLILVMHSNKPVTLRLDAQGPADVTAADIGITSDIEIKNPDLHIATLNHKGSLKAEITVDRGRGYVSAERNKTSTDIGVIPVDSIYSPVRRVSFSVEDTRVEQSTDYDRLLLDVETDGSITPLEALASAGATLRALLQLVEELSGDPQGLELGEAGNAAMEGPDLNRSIDDLGLATRTVHCLHQVGIETLEDLLGETRDEGKTRDELLTIPNFGQKSSEDVEAALARLSEQDGFDYSLRREI